MRGERGVALVIALFVVVMLLIVAAGVLTNSSYSADDALSVQKKNEAFNAAEAGLAVAQWKLDENFGATSSGSGFIDNGYTYTWAIAANRLHLVGGTTINDPDPMRSASITVGGGEALLVGSGSAIHGGRPVYVEKMVVLDPPVYLPANAITCGGTATISHQQITDISGKHSANIDCFSILSSGGGQHPDGLSLATGTTNDITGTDGRAHTGEPPPAFLTAEELSIEQTMVQYQAGTSGNFSTAGDVTGGTIGTPAGNCVAFIGGNVTLIGSSTLINYCETTVVMGNVNVGGSATYQALPPGTAHIVYVFGTGGTVLQGTPTTVGIFYVANASVTVNGGGSGNFAGAIITPNNVTMRGGGAATFSYNGNETPPPFVPNTVATLSQWDY